MMPDPVHALGTATFLEQYWQRQPCLLRGAATDLPGLDADEVAGLALEEAVESRLVQSDRSADDGAAEFRLTHGPQRERTLTGLGEDNWTLLVHGLDQLLPELAELAGAITCVPRWRLDDIMVSLAGRGGGVGPHLDRYDVFLIQHPGRRRWRVGAVGDASLAPRGGQPLSLLQPFEAVHDWVLEPGDVLYLPPNVAHWGTALDAGCMTLSVGFRAPSCAALLEALVDTPAAAELFGDAGRPPPQHPHEIGAFDLRAARRSLERLLASDAALLEALGRAVTEPTRTLELGALPGRAHGLRPGIRVATSTAGTDRALFFADGEQFDLPRPLALELSACAARGAVLPAATRRAAAADLRPLYNAGVLLSEDVDSFEEDAL